MGFVILILALAAIVLAFFRPTWAIVALGVAILLMVLPNLA